MLLYFCLPMFRNGAQVFLLLWGLGFENSWDSWDNSVLYSWAVSFLNCRILTCDFYWTRQIFLVSGVFPLVSKPASGFAHLEKFPTDTIPLLCFDPLPGKIYVPWIYFLRHFALFPSSEDDFFGVVGDHTSLSDSLFLISPVLHPRPCHLTANSIDPWNTW